MGKGEISAFLGSSGSSNVFSAIDGPHADPLVIHLDVNACKRRFLCQAPPVTTAVSTELRELSLTLSSCGVHGRKLPDVACRTERSRKSIGPSFAQPLKEMHVNERILLRFLVYWF